MKSNLRCGIGKKAAAFSALFFLLILIAQPSRAQEFSSPAEYNNYLLSDEASVSKKYLAYISAMAHSKSIRKIEKQRSKLVSKIEQVYTKVGGAPSYKGDKQLRDASSEYYKACLALLTDDYQRIGAMEQASEESYENMEKYVKTKQAAEQKYEAAYEKAKLAQKEFAKRYNIQIVDDPAMNKMQENFEKVARVNEYQQNLQLIFFKSYKTEFGMWEALNKKDYKSAEKFRADLSAFARQGLAQLQQVQAFDGDASLITNLKAMLEFYQQEADEKAVKVIGFPEQEQAFAKLRSELESKPKKDRTQADIDKYNKGVDAFNKYVNEVNSLSAEINNRRNGLLMVWNNGVQQFLDKHVPMYDDQDMDA
jgi:hypothetical protein